ncbi:hypothetical protein IMZ48_25515 [Candidatus Bathyarchaeota archaeon]|nr:hypothetical protein [Candidatus Bathyarchaeota archaeon]
MGEYDSDSSQEDYTETNTLLGYVSKEPEDDSISRLGGQPVRLRLPHHSNPSTGFLLSARSKTELTHAQEWLDPETPPSAALARCGACGDIMTLLMQLNGELADRFPGHERMLYVFVCRTPKCRRRDGSVRALRGVRVSKEVAEAAREADKRAEEERKASEKREKEEREKQAGLGSALFGSGGGGAGANPFGGGGGNNPFGGATNPFSAPEKKEEVVEVKVEDLHKTFAETLSLNNTQPQTGAAPPPKPEAWPEDAALPRAYPTLYLTDVDYETLDVAPPSIPTDAHVEMMETEIDDSPAGPEPSGKDDLDSVMDNTFQKFADRMEQNPEQVVRYEFAGQPLMYSKDGKAAKAVESGLPRGGGGGGGRVFELQLTPHAIAELEAEEMGLEGMDWGTIIMGVCAADCQAPGVGDGEVGYLEEWVGVQWEELSE